MRISIIIVNWNAGSQLIDAVSSIALHHNGLVNSVIIVDNASTDNSLKKVANIETFPFRLRVICNTSNMGFAAACNQGAKDSCADYLLFLNPDTRLNGMSLLAPISFMESEENQGIGICGIQLIDEHGRVSRTCARFPTLWRFVARALGLDKVPGLKGLAVHMSDWDHTETRLVDHVIGAFFLIRRDVFEDLGGFDERFFVYLEDLDLSYRAYQAGWRSVYLAEAQAFHAGGGTSRQVKAHRLFYSLRSRLLYGFKHFPRWQAWCLVAVTGVLEPVVRAMWCLVRGDIASLLHTGTAYRMLWRGMKRIVRGEGRFEP